MGARGQRHAPAALPPGKKTWYTLYRGLCGPQDLSGRVQKISPHTGIGVTSTDFIVKVELEYQANFSEVLSPPPPTLMINLCDKAIWPKIRDMKL